MNVMRKSSSVTKLFLFILIVGTLCGYGYYYFFMRDNEISESDVAPSLSRDKVSDTKNGIYVIKNNTISKKTLLKKCVIDSINDYIVVINENYYMYRGNCLNTIYLGQGSTEKLKFEKDNNSEYSVELEDVIYRKDYTTDKIVVENKVVSNNAVSYDYDSLKLVIDYSEFPNNYYSFIGNILYNNSYMFNYVYNKDFNSFSFNISYIQSSIFSKSMKSFDDIPYFYSLGNNMVIIDLNKDGNRYGSHLFVYSGADKTYDYNSMFPLYVNNNIIDSTWNRIFRYDATNKVAYVLFSKTNDFCDFSDGNAYYEFKLSYDYKKNGFNAPDLYKKGINSKDCNYAKKYYLIG